MALKLLAEIKPLSLSGMLFLNLSIQLIPSLPSALPQRTPTELCSPKARGSQILVHPGITLGGQGNYDLLGSGSAHGLHF